MFQHYFGFVWRNARRLGIPDAAIDDAVQDVFLVVHRRFGEFEFRSSIETWLLSILLRVAHDYRRSVRRKNALLSELENSLPARQAADDAARGPMEIVAKREALALVHRIFEELDDDERALLSFVELEQMSVPEVAETMGLNVNTAYTKLRAARQAFENALARHQGRERKAQP